MGFLAQVRHSLGRGIQVSMELPQDFAWEDEVIPLRLHLTREPSQPDTTAEVKFHLFDEEAGSRSNSGTEHGVNHRWAIGEPIALPTGASLVLPIQMPLPFDAEAIEQAAEATRHGERFVDRLAGSLTLGALHPPTHLPWFRLSAAVKAEGALLPSRASGKIRCRNAGPDYSIRPTFG